ncbi:unnamed protein product [Acanthoscelides obtectus]|uniref:Uncharacterized protein n=1 Tax=Acanthoscelides obtectus TaxID=200917 RepID=A0A9P0LZH2_ACAOB|nr:unnamed protein product [Acanthoscelides obtectus]CAK1651543.1 hypothetical protein AOBTE_LOCUS17338 [Acanthoscelides obtectus]
MYGEKDTRLKLTSPNIAIPLPKKLEFAEILFPDMVAVAWEQTTPFTIHELLAAADRLRPNKAPGPDNIPSQIVKLATRQFQETMLKVMNNAITTGSCPATCKHAELIMSPKRHKHLMQRISVRFHY